MGAILPLMQWPPCLRRTERYKTRTPTRAGSNAIDIKVSRSTFQSIEISTDDGMVHFNIIPG